MRCVSMKRFLEFIKAIPLKKKIKYGVMLFCILLTIVLICLGNHIKGLTQDTFAAQRWDDKNGYTQMSAYLPVGLMEDASLYDGMLYQMEEALKNESIQPENDNSRMLLGAYSGYGRVTLQSDKATVNVKAIGVGGDFFYFHPIEMIDGEYLTDDYLMQDYVILDRKTAWDLFGAMQVSGMTVTINNTPFLVAGVYEPSDVYLSEEAGVQEKGIFMFYSALKQQGSTAGIQWLDFLLPNPVKDYGSKIFKENATISLEEAVVIEQSTRYNVLSLYQLIPDYTKRCMSQSGIVYPYWENMTRGYENVLVAFLLVETVCLSCTVVLLWISIKPVKNIKRGCRWFMHKVRGRKAYEE